MSIHRSFAILLRLFLISLAFAISQCASNGKGSSSFPEVLTIEFGNGGGFTGKTTTFILASNGTLSRKNEQGMVASVDKKTLMTLFEKAQALKDIKYNEPGNIYNFMQLEFPTGKNRIVWKPEQGDFNQDVVNLHKQLMALTTPK